MPCERPSVASGAPSVPRYRKVCTIPSKSFSRAHASLRSQGQTLAVDWGTGVGGLSLGALSPASVSHIHSEAISNAHL